jgi:hypothetical protein
MPEGGSVSTSRERDSMTALPPQLNHRGQHAASKTRRSSQPPHGRARQERTLVSACARELNDGAPRDARQDGARQRRCADGAPKAAWRAQRAARGAGIGDSRCVWQILPRARRQEVQWAAEGPTAGSAAVLGSAWLFPTSAPRGRRLMEQCRPRGGEGCSGQLGLGAPVHVGLAWRLARTHALVLGFRAPAVADLQWLVMHQHSGTM